MLPKTVTVPLNTLPIASGSEAPRMFSSTQAPIGNSCIFASALPAAALMASQRSVACAAICLPKR